MTSTTTVRISKSAMKELKNLAAETDCNLQTTLERALEEYSRKIIFEKAHRAYEELKQDSEAWREEMEEREVWDGALLDGLDE